MRRLVRRLFVLIALALPAAGCGEDAKPVGKNAPPPTEKQLSKEQMKGGK